MYDIFSIGGTALDVFMQIHEASVNCQINTAICQLCMNYAEKIPVEKVLNVAGVGTAPNNAVGSARLGMKAALYTIVGDDSAGRDALDIFKKEKVATKYVMLDKKNRTDYSTVISFKGERTLLTFQVPRVYRLPKDLKTKWMFLGALPAGQRLLHEQIVRKVKKEGIKLGFNPGANELREGIESIKPLLAISEVLIINKEEAWRLLGKNDEIKTLLSKFHQYGSKIVVVTDGKKGAYCFNGENYYHQSIFDSPVVERTGAGDAFATGFIAALFHGLTTNEALIWGTANAGSVVKHVGAQIGLLTKPKMKQFIKKYGGALPTAF